MNKLDAKLTVTKSFEAFENLVSLAEYFLGKKNYIAATVLAQIAVDFAVWHHPGVFFSPRLEEVLRRVGASTTQEYTTKKLLAPKIKNSENVLHVLTCAKSIGGHTRFVWNWIQNDTDRCHSAVLTSQENKEVPKKLCEAISGTGGKLHVLDPKLCSPISRAKMLRKISESADLVILQINVEDVIPFVAFANKKNRPPVIFVTQNDINFWVGVCTSDIVVHLRDSTWRLAEKRREIEKERTALIPIPVRPVCTKFSKSKSKNKIGIGKDMIVLLSIARPAKYKSNFKPNFLEMIEPLIERYTNLILIVIGPDCKGEWAAAKERTNGRIIAFGPRIDTETFYKAADIYLDSFPQASNTSLLEAGTYGLPLISYFPFSEESEVLGAGSPGLEDTLIRENNIKTYREAIISLIENAKFRLCTGEKTRKKILELHSGSGWKSFLDDLYEKAFTKHPTSKVYSIEDKMIVGEIDLLLHNIYGFDSDLRRVNERYIKPLPYYIRLQICYKLLQLNKLLSSSLLLPNLVTRYLEKPANVLRGLKGIHSFLNYKKF